MHPFRITCDMSAVSLLESRVYFYILAINNNNNKVQCVTARRRVWAQLIEGGP